MIRLLSSSTGSFSWRSSMFPGEDSQMIKSYIHHGTAWVIRIRKRSILSSQSPFSVRRRCYVTLGRSSFFHRLTSALRSLRSLWQEVGHRALTPSPLKLKNTQVMAATPLTGKLCVGNHRNPKAQMSSRLHHVPKWTG